MNIEDLNEEIRACQKCRLSKTRKNVLCGEGDVHAQLMLIAQAPGENEDREGNMFIGPSGKVLDELLKEADVRREDIYMTNLIKCMLPKNRKPKQHEIEMCSPYVDKEIELVDPRVIAPLGYYATKYILEKYEILCPSKSEFYLVYGKILLVGEKTILPLQHPAAVLYNSDMKELMVKNYCNLAYFMNTGFMVEN